MNKLERLVSNYQKHVSLPWKANIHGDQKVWFVVYDMGEERRLRCRLGEFELVTKEAGHKWALVDLTNIFAEWMAQKEHREEYFEAPEFLESSLPDFLEYAADAVRSVLTSQEADGGTVVAILGVGSLFGFVRVSSLLKEVTSAIRGRLLVFFPGDYEDNTYRLMDARDGWNYRAVPITHQEGVLE